MTVSIDQAPASIGGEEVVDARFSGGAYVVSTSMFNGHRVVTLESPEEGDMPLLPHEALALACALLSHASAVIPPSAPRVVASFSCPCGLRSDLFEGHNPEERDGFDRDVIDHADICPVGRD
ncbi:hypothetical protein [Microbacterium allomyrinae]|uniref:Uncharacterized protein n=1 Tax=Microbacterium allomyrinae TaxID=2830666 RepID=A0A9X1LRW6_9MICO|nr:hypothetical protein [Microbacterium allomyrinae]MCC2030648.1 hypothetical protein [Microbacterium allomyrinae]